MTGLEVGPPDRPIDVVFLHANGFNAGTYLQVLQPLADRLRIVALDQRGHGASRLPAEPDGRTHWLEFGHDLIGALRALKLTAPVVLSGHSMGGTACLLTAAEAPDMVRALVLFDPVFPRPRGVKPPHSPQTSRLIEGALRRRRAFESAEAAIEAYVGRGAFKSWPRQTVVDYVNYGVRPTADGVELACTPEWEASNFNAQGTDLWAPLDRLSRPLTIFKAEHGSTCLLSADTPEIADHADRSVTQVEGASHFLPMERPDIVQAALLKACGA